MNRIIQADCIKQMCSLDSAGHSYDCVFMDPPDNIGLDYGDGGAGDKMKYDDYFAMIQNAIAWSMKLSPVVWISFNSRWTIPVGCIAQYLLANRVKTGDESWEVKACVQTFTFGQQRKTDLSNCHRPLWRIRSLDRSKLYPEDVLVESWRQKNGDKRAAPGGKVPSDVFDFPRVTGNSKQRRKYHPTQLHEGLVERCIRLTTKPGDSVLDPFAGTGTTLRVCKRIDRNCTLIERDPTYAAKIAEEHKLRLERL